MRCSNGHDNPEGKRFCGECGEALTPASTAESGATSPVADDEGKSTPSPSTAGTTGTAVAETTSTSGGDRRRPSRGTALVVLAVIAAIVVGIVVASGGGDNNEQVSAGRPRSSVVTRADREISTTTSSEVNQRDLEIVKQGFTTFSQEYIDTPLGSYGVVFKNPNRTSWVANRVSINVSFFDAAGTVVKTETDTLTAILPGQSAAVGDTVYDLPPSAVRIETQASVGDWTEFEGSTGAFAFEGLSTTPEEYGGLRTNATVRSSFVEDQKNVEITAIYTRADGSIVGGAYTFLDFVPAGGAIGVEISATSTIPGVVGTELYGDIGF